MNTLSLEKLQQDKLTGTMSHRCTDDCWGFCTVRGRSHCKMLRAVKPRLPRNKEKPQTSLTAYASGTPSSQAHSEWKAHIVWDGQSSYQLFSSVVSKQSHVSISSRYSLCFHINHAAALRLVLLFLLLHLLIVSTYLNVDDIFKLTWRARRLYFTYP